MVLMSFWNFRLYLFSLPFFHYFFFYSLLSFLNELILLIRIKLGALFTNYVSTGVTVSTVYFKLMMRAYHMA